ncbi:unnamed protein product [Periconia digitata]|uniref:TEA domain-containing protein n=1 Tax=Periconia digitata TaxID=1303443 RepID=A0A9W4UNL6_9PLEO|nr:unnamed protein product [Periconia digitata]
MMELHHTPCLLESALAEASILGNALQTGSVNRGGGGSFLDVSPAYATFREDGCLTRFGEQFQRELSPHLSHYHRSEADIDRELKKVIGYLAKSEKYQKYREPPTTKKQKEQVWPNHREIAFFRALIRYPPTGRKKYMRDGKPRGRNELVADSIDRETGEKCDRKHVSSHLQVLKKILVDCPEVLVYMPKGKDDKKSSKRVRYGSHHHHRSRHTRLKYGESQEECGSHGHYGHMSSSTALSKSENRRDDALFSVASFVIIVIGSGEAHKLREVHRYTELAQDPRLADVRVRDTTSWHKQFPEFNFHRIEELSNRSILVCDATIKVMTRALPSEAELSITFDLASPPALAAYDDLECSTRFFEDGKPVEQDDNHHYQAKQASKGVDKQMGHKGLLRIKFGAGFWARQLQRLGNLLCKASEEEPNIRSRYESSVRRELQQLTAAQDIYGVKDGESKCLLTILWRFSQTRHSQDTGSVKWRAVHFEQPKDRVHIKDEAVSNALGALMTPPTTSTTGPPTPIATSASLIYPSLPLEFNHAFPEPDPPLDMDQITLDNITADFSHPASTASGIGHDFSQFQTTLSSMTDSHNMIGTQGQGLEEADNFDFHGGHIAISGCLEPAVSFESYASFEAQSNAQSFQSLPSLADFEQTAQAMQAETTFEDLALGMSMTGSTDYVAAPKPSWPHPSLIAQLGHAAEHYSDLMAQTTTGGQMDLGEGLEQGGDDGGGSSLSSHGLWKLQSGFDEDTIAAAAAAAVGHDSRKDSLVGKGDDGVLRIMELVGGEERVDRYREY